jgi:hypothetical protein
VKEKILSELKTKFKNLGFGEKAFDGVADYISKTVTKDEDIETAIAGVEPLLKAFQGDSDKRVTDAVAKVKAEPKPAESSKQVEKPKPADTGNDIPEWAKGLISKLESFEKKETQSALMAKLKAKIADKVPDSYLKGRSITIESEDQIDQLATSIEGDFTAFKQDLINQGVFVESPKSSQNSPKAGVDFAIAEAKRRNAGGSADNPVEGIKLM